MTTTNSSNIPVAARIRLFELEIVYVQFLTRKGKGDGLRAAAAVRVLTLQKELSELRQDITKKGGE